MYSVRIQTSPELVISQIMKQQGGMSVFWGEGEKKDDWLLGILPWFITHLKNSVWVESASEKLVSGPQHVVLKSDLRLLCSSGVSHFQSQGEEPCLCAVPCSLEHFPRPQVFQPACKHLLTALHASRRYVGGLVGCDWNYREDIACCEPSACLTWDVALKMYRNMLHLIYSIIHT